ncbi:uncharacterized protein LACBIDRAFT_303796 [Laccaria bicolor S238N-H82]|uniref:Predicted protein n=1 Tax=Laccaria bicolor (strain S238N-H82 / ATCC MYA-4686) TaxID=486041 RepID=B0DKC2_LACBS|nr:uncharacterized protein LACBIDRAFT_303796 [Laccaria bicolor S238N-H82]EDR04916.1 predicted protein [Laccaria bicolor S238N-H82]|eukprot:XP_001884306.1 predicted protein [Laccaria bicolor S238N-H82]
MTQRCSDHDIPNLHLVTIQPLVHFYFPEARRLSFYQRFQAFPPEIITISHKNTTISLWPNVKIGLILADPAAIKPLEDYEPLKIFGPSILTSEGEQWKRYRKIVAPAFSDRNYKMVWDETVRIVNGCFDTWGDRKVVVVDHCLADVTLPISLGIISAAGFGKRLEWDDDLAPIPEGHKISFKESIDIVSSKFVNRAAFADWCLNLTEDGRKIKLAYDELAAYMSEMVKERLSMGKREHSDLFSNLLASSFSHEFGATALTEAEIIGNIFVFLLAGHETTAHTLCFTFALLALYPDEQEVLFQHIKSVLSDGRTPEHKDIPLLTQSMAVLFETLRLYPVATFILKESAEDTTLNASNIRGEKATIHVPKGTLLQISPAGVHYNPRYWEDPHAFKPSRFLNPDWPRDAFIPFSAGPRACIGRKFFETEGIAILTMIVAKYKITVKEEPQFAGETFEQRKERIMKAYAAITLTPIRVPLVFSRRH